MSEALPRAWRQFDSRWKKSGGMERFVAVSIVLHVILAASWAAPKYVAYRIRQGVLREKAIAELERKESIRKEVENVDAVIRDEARKDIAETQLREFFEELVKDLLSEEELERRWSELLRELEFDIDALNALLVADGYDALLVDEHVVMLREKMLNSLHDMVAGDLQAEWKARYLKYLEAVMGRLAEHFRKELNAKIGTPLSRETQRFLDREVAEVKKAISRTVSDLQTVKREADRQKGRMEQTSARARKEMTSDERRRREIFATETGTLRDAAAKLESTGKPLEDASRRMADIEKGVADRIATIRETHLSTATDGVASVISGIADEKYEAAAGDGERTVASIVVMSDETQKAIDETAAVNVEDVVARRLRSVYAELEKSELRSAFEDAFRKEYGEHAYAELYGLLDTQFQEEAKKKGIIPPPLSIEKELAEMLGQLLPDMTDAGATTTTQLREQHALSEHTDMAGDGEMEKRAVGAVGGLAGKLIDEEMRKVVTSALGNRRSWLLGSEEMELDEHGLADVALLDRLGNLKNQAEQGRRDFLGRGDNASLMSARIRQRSLSRFRGRLLSYDIGFDPEAYMMMVEKMKNREAAQGELFTFEGETGEASSVAAEVGLKPEVLLVHENQETAKNAEDETARTVEPPSFKYNRFAGIPYLSTPRLP